MSYLEIVDARKHNLKNIHLKIPKKQLVVVTGVSGSGKSSLAYDTIFQEGQRKYLESLSAYARQFLKSLERPDVQSIKGIAPTISIDQKHASFYFNSTVGTVSEVTSYLRLLFARIGEARCPSCGKKISHYSAEGIVDVIFQRFRNRLVHIYSPVVKNRKGHYQALFDKYRKRGFLKTMINGVTHYLDSVPSLDRNVRHHISILIDAVEVHEPNRGQIADSVHLGLNEGNGELLVIADRQPHLFSNKLYCPDCDLALKEPQPGTFSFNSPEGACPDCHGIGSDADQIACSECLGSGLNREARSFFFRGRNIFDLGELEVSDLLRFFKDVRLRDEEQEIVRPLMPQIVQRLESFVKLNLGYISLNRKVNTVSGGELQRTRLVSQIGFSLNGIIYILDEPSIGMHISEQINLIHLLRLLKEKGNSIIVVEHDEETIKSADFVVDMGPGAGERGGEVVYAGWLKNFAAAGHSLTSDYIFKRKRIDIDKPNPRPFHEFIDIRRISVNNIDGIDLRIPLNAMTVVTGVSGSGKSSLIIDALYPILIDRIDHSGIRNRRLKFGEVKTIGPVKRALMVTQSAIGKNSRSCPATYIGIMPLIRELFAGLPEAKIRGYRQNRFSFNVRGGRCEACEGLGVQKLQMSFLPQLEIQCPICEGKRFNSETRKVKYKGFSIADILDLTGSEAYNLFLNLPLLSKKIKILVDVGLGYLRLGQSSVTLSGGESQRIKLTKELSKISGKPTVYVLDEPTVGLHFEDIKKLIEVFLALLSRGHTIVVIEHNLEMIRAADYLIDLGPGGGHNGGKIIYEGPVDGILRHERSLTGQYLRKKIENDV
jgi:excinuclease ABC subunit A